MIFRHFVTRSVALALVVLVAISGIAGWTVGASETEVGIFEYDHSTRGIKWEYNYSTSELNIYGSGALIDNDEHEEYMLYKLKDPLSVKTIIIDDRITEIGRNIFTGLYKVRDIKFPASLKKIGKAAFMDFNVLSDIKLPEGLTTIGTYAFKNCDNVEEIELPSTVTSISGYAFESCELLEKVVIPRGIKTIGTGAFSGCKKLTIYGYRDTAAYVYCLQNNVPFVDLDPAKETEQNVIVAPTDVQPKTTVTRATKAAKTKATTVPTTAVVTEPEDTPADAPRNSVWYLIGGGVLLLAGVVIVVLIVVVRKK